MGPLHKTTMKQHDWAIFSFVGLLALAALACTIPGTSPSAPPNTPTPMGDTLSFSMPAYTYNMEPGSTIPGTQLEYVGPTQDGYEVRIDGQSAIKRIGDSFLWSGVIAPSVYGNYNLRLTTEIFGSLPVAGNVEIVVFNPEPTELTATGEILAQQYYNNIVINYVIPAGREIPGTPMTYVGITTQGTGDQATTLAQLSGTTGYPYLAVGDSLVWQGQLRDNVIIRYDLRAASIDETDGLRLLGTAELWVLP